MGKDLIIKLLESQLEVSNATISQLRLTVDTLNGTISDLRATIVRLESLLMERDESLDKANNQVRGMSRLLEKTALLFDNLYKAMQKAVKEDSNLCCDETYHRVLVKKELNDGRGSRKGYVWVIVAAHLGLAYFFYDDGSRSEEVIVKELKGYSGAIQSDGLGAYKKVAAQSEGKILRLACLQHCRERSWTRKAMPMQTG